MPGPVHGLRCLLVVLVAAHVVAAGSDTEPSGHWSFAPPSEVAPPKVKRTRWVQSPIDAFILAQLEAARLSPAPPADKATLLRRVTFDLIGLPPTPAELDDFLADETPGAFGRVVNRLLASPRYGERWGRHWLDVARYADSNGQDENKAMANAWRYRDYVIQAFNQDKPFDQFIREQLAGDLLTPSPDEQTEFERRIATGFLVLGPKMLAEQDKPKLVMDVVDEQIDVVSRAFLGLTVSCSRCHDHKFDPIPTRDYYALAGIFKSTKTMADLAFVSQWNERSVASPKERARYDAHVQRTNEVAKLLAAAIREADAAVRARWSRLVVDPLIRQWSFDPADDADRPSLVDETLRASSVETGSRLATPADLRPFFSASHVKAVTRLEAERTQLATNAPAPPPAALAVEEGTPIDLPVHLRGSHLSPAKEPVPRGFLAVIHRHAPSPPRSTAPIPNGHSGRLELAEWLTDPAHPLTARVTVNRLWQSHFGEGLVRSPDNFGLRGERPTHPELLDWLAREFIRSGWSVKQFHRLLVLSSTYQMSTAFDAKSAQADPDNRLLWRMNRRRLEAEPLRDALLAIANRLDRTMGGSLVNWRNAEYTPDDAISPTSRRRAVYLPVVRDRVYDVFTIFDFANPSVGVSQRTPTVATPQALFFLNSPFVKEQARHLANSLLACPGEDRARIDSAYRQVLGRPPTSPEIAQAIRYLADARQSRSPVAPDDSKAEVRDWAEFCQVLFASNEFFYVN